MTKGKSNGTVRRSRVVRVFRKRIGLALREAEKAATRADKALARCRELVRLFEILVGPVPAATPAAEVVEVVPETVVQETVVPETCAKED